MLDRDRKTGKNSLNMVQGYGASSYIYKNDVDTDR